MAANSSSMVEQFVPGKNNSELCKASYLQLEELIDDNGLLNETDFFQKILLNCKNAHNICPIYLYNLSGDELMANLAHIMPVQHYEYSFIIPFAVIIVALIVVGFFGNLFTIIVILRNRVLQTTSHYLISLALSDMLLLVLTGPTEVMVELRYWPWTYTRFLCHARFFLIEFCTFTTVLHITAFTVERYVAICHPMKAKSFISTSRAIKFIVAIWIMSFLISIPLYISYNLMQVCTGIAESTLCQPKSEWDASITHFYIFSATVLFLFPMSLIIVLYSLIARVLFGVDIKVSMRRSSSTKARKGATRGRLNDSVKTKENTEDVVIKTRKQVVKMLALIAASFFICWFPFHLIRISPMFDYEHWPKAFLKIYYKGLYHFSIVMLYISSTINPILYNVMSARFRRAFKQTILCQEVSSPSNSYANRGQSGSFVTRSSSINSSAL